MPRRPDLLLVAAVLAAAALPASAQPPVHTSHRGVTLSGYGQLQYELTSRDEQTSDRVYARRATVTLDGTPADHWHLRVQADLGPLSTHGRALLKDAYLLYTGLAAHGLTVSVGNQKAPFSRSLYAPSSRRGLVERPVTGERALGAPGRSIALKVDGAARSESLQWSASLGTARHAPDPSSLRIDGAAEAGADWSPGVLAVARLELHPWGPTPREWGAFGGPTRFVIGAAAYAWTNDGRRNGYTAGGQATSRTRADVQRARGFEVSAGWRGTRLSVDTEYHRVTATAVDRSFTGGLYASGDAALHESGVEGGLMILPHTLEFLGAFDTLAAAGRGALAYRPAVGANYYIVGHALKLSVMRRETMNDRGVRGARLHATYAQAQVAF